MRVRAAGDELEPALQQRFAECVCVRADLGLVGAECLCRRDAEARRLRRDRVHERPALHARHHRAVERLRVLLAAEDEAAPRPRERLVRRRRDEVTVLDRARHETGGDEPGEVRHVAEQERADLVRDRTETVGLDHTRIRGATADDDLRARLLRQPQHLVVVDRHRLARDAVVDDVVQPAREVDLVTVRQMAALVEPQRQQRVARLHRGRVHRHVRLGARVRLDVRMLGAEQRLRTVDSKLLDLVHDLTAAVVAAPGIPLGVLVRRHRPDRLEHRRPREVLGGDQLQLSALALELLPEQRGDIGIDVRQARGLQVLERLLGQSHREDGNQSSSDHGFRPIDRTWASFDFSRSSRPPSSSRLPRSPAPTSSWAPPRTARSGATRPPR